MINLIQSYQYKNIQNEMTGEWEPAPIQHQRKMLKDQLSEISRGVRAAMVELLGADSDLNPKDDEIQEILKSENGERKHAQLLNSFFEMEFKRKIRSRDIRGLVRERIKKGLSRDLLDAGFPEGTILSEVTAMAKNPDGTPKYSRYQIISIYNYAIALGNKLSADTETAPVTLDLEREN